MSPRKVKESEESFQIGIGDVVRLKSGGPAMTVTDIYGSDSRLSMKCMWFDKELNANHDMFPCLTLNRVEQL